MTEPAHEEPNLAKEAYEAYARSTGGKTFDGKRMPKYEDLPLRVATAWQAAAEHIVSLVECDCEEAEAIDLSDDEIASFRKEFAREGTFAILFGRQLMTGTYNDDGDRTDFTRESRDTTLAAFKDQGHECEAFP